MTVYEHLSQKVGSLLQPLDGIHDRLTIKSIDNPGNCYLIVKVLEYPNVLESAQFITTIGNHRFSANLADRFDIEGSCQCELMFGDKLISVVIVGGTYNIL